MVVTATLLPIQTAQAESAGVIEEVVVTARKRQETLQEVPVVVNVLTEDTINSQRIEGIKDIGTIVPGMVASQTISGTSGFIYLRGVGTGSGNPGFDQAAGARRLFARGGAGLESHGEAGGCGHRLRC